MVVCLRRGWGVWGVGCLWTLLGLVLLVGLGLVRVLVVLRVRGLGLLVLGLLVGLVVCLVGVRCW
jgi:hypothetical protein